MTDLLLREDRGGTAILTLNRPESLNALSPSLFVELRAQLDAIAASQDTIGCVVLRGAGRAFSAGNDIKAIQAGDRAPGPHFQAETLDAIEALPQPVIASVHGYCYTGALELALACDLCVAAESARFADTHGRWSMTPTWGMSQRLPRRIGPLAAKLMMFTGRVITGQEAAAIGLVNQCVPDADLEQATIALAEEILASSWHTLRGDKRLVNEGQRYTLADGLRYERQTSPGAGPDMAERLRGFGAKNQ
jgi:enoyl-CoA hydratase/carnithine racemase